MGRNKIPFTGHTELRKTFKRKGAIKRSETNGTDIRMWLIYTQVEHKQGYGYIYEVNYDGQIFYNVFKEHYDTNCEGATIVTYPNDNAFYENEWQWAWTTRTLEEAKEILNTFESNI